MNLQLFSDNRKDLETRLIERHKRIITENLDAINGKTVLDLAANNGRWSYAAIQAGASHVISIEAREERAQQAQVFFEELGVSELIDVNIGDMYYWLYESRHLNVDTVFCLGVYYHVMDHYMLLKQIAQLTPKTIIIDSGFVRSFRNSVQIKSENPNLYSNALKVYEGQTSEVIGVVSLGLMIQMAWNLGYNCYPILWDPKTIADQECVHDYMIGRRYTLRLDKIDGNQDQNWKDKWKKALTALHPSYIDLLECSTHDKYADARIKHSLKNMSFSIM